MAGGEIEALREQAVAFIKMAQEHEDRGVAVRELQQFINTIQAKLQELADDQPGV